MTEAEVLTLFESCRNWTRWSDTSERGTLNYITPKMILRALSLVRHGIVVSLGRNLSVQDSDPAEFSHRMRAGDDHSVADETTIAPHGFTVTHLDAVSHSHFQQRIFGGQLVSPPELTEGLPYGSIVAMGDGVITRGVLLDIPQVRGVPTLKDGDQIEVADLIAAERLAGVTVETGDAVFVRSGLKEPTPAVSSHDDQGVRTGMGPDTIEWLHRRRVAVYSGDCIDRLPSGYPAVPLPLHQVGQVAMGLAILDNPDLGRLYAVTQQLQRSTFLLMIAPLRVMGGTGSAVNPLAVF